MRALFLNIVGDTKTEIEEGVTWTTGEIAGLKDVIKQYAPEAYKAAQATGSIIDPMKAIGGLAESMKAGVLSEQKLMEMVSDIGGKLRTSQLLALIQNWDMYNNMLKDTANSAGSADKEIANAMDSWTRKTNVLKNTWAEFIKSGLNSDQIKFLLDALTWIVKHLGTLNGAVSRLAIVLTALKLHSTAKELTQISKGLLDVEKDASRAAKAFSKMGASAKGLNIAAGVIGALGLAWAAYSAIRAEQDRKHQERVQAIYDEADAAKESANNVLDLYVEMDTAADSASDFTAQAKTLADALGVDLADGAEKARKKIAELSAEQLKSAADKANTAYLTSLDDYMYQTYGAGSDTYWGNLENLGNVRKYFMGGVPADLQAKIFEAYSKAPTSTNSYTGEQFIDVSTTENALQYRKVLEEIVSIRDEYIRQGGDAAILDSKYFSAVDEYLGQTANAFNAVEAARKNAIDTEAMEIFQRVVTNGSVQNQEDLDALISRFRGARDVSDEVREKLIELANKYYNFSEAVNESSNALKQETVDLYANQKALDANATSEERAAAAKKDAANAAKILIPYLFDESNQLTAVGKAALMSDKNLAGLVQSELEAQLAAKQANYSSLVAQIATVGITAETTAAQLWAMARAAAGDNPFSGAIMGAIGGAYTGYQGLLQSRMAEIKALMSQISGISSYSGTAPSWTPSGSSGHSSSGHSGGSSGSGSSGSTEDKKLTALKNRVSLLKSELSLMQERGDSEEDQAAKMREIMEALKNEADYLKSIKGDQITINNLTQEWWSYNNKLSELMDKEAKAAQEQAEALQKAVDAQKALNNALKDRSVRYYNAQTGQWEWTANPENVANAQKARDEAVAAAGYGDNEAAWNLYFAMASMLSSVQEAANVLNANPGASVWDLPNLMSNSYTSNYGGTTNSNIYNFNGFSMSEQQARGTTLYEMALRSRMLALHNSSY